MSDSVEFTVLGKAEPAGSKRAIPIRCKDGSTRNVVIDANKSAKPWQAEVRCAAAAAWGVRGLLTGPVEVSMVFSRVRPQGHYRTGRHAGELREGASTAPTMRPDVLKLARAIEDALTGIIYRDDSQTVRMTLEKVWGERACVKVSVRSLEGAKGVQDGGSSSEAATDLCGVSHHLA